MKIIHFPLLAMLLFAANLHGQAKQASAENKVDKNIATIKAAYEALNQRNWEAFAASCAANYTEENVAPTPTVGVQNAIALYKQFVDGFPDFKIKINDIAPAGNNRYLLRVSITGTNTGTFMGMAPTGKAIKFDDADLVVLNAEGKCISHSVTNTGEPLVQIGHASMANPSTQVVMAAYDKFSKGDIPGLLALCDDKVVFDIEDRMFDAKARTFMGKAEVGKFFEELGSKVKYSKFMPTRFVADGDDVFILVDTEYQHLPTMKNYASTYTHHFKVVNGKVTYFKGLDGFAVMK